MISAYQSALSALQAFSTKTESTANNIANVNSSGYKKTRVTLNERPSAGVQASVDKINAPGTSIYEQTNNGMDVVELSNVDLTTELPEMSITSQFYKANLKTIETVDKMAGAVLNIKS